jgi:asparagine synthase (glutamine-hydrolysing)
MVAALAHRGPDGNGIWTTRIPRDGRTVALGHTRLAILDLSDRAGQPFHGAPDTWGAGLTIAFNGEIYNYLELRAELVALGHPFRTDSDTEVLLAAYAVWGESGFAKLRGMFAFAIWDGPRARLVLARDPFGKKPLLYLRDKDELVFASEIAALSEHPAFRPDLDIKALGQYMVFKYVPGPATLVRAVSELPPGHFAVWKRGDLTIQRFYRPPPPETDPARRLPWTADTVAAFRSELSEAVRLRMRSDVALGAFLSGGLDSSSIVALMAEQSGQPVRTFSIGFEEEEFSELWAARLVAARFKTQHHELKVSPDDFLDSIETVTAFRGAPLTEMADIPVYLLSRMAARHVKVVLSGEGSDELLAGYPKHWGDLAAVRYHRLVPKAFDRLMLGLPATVSGYGARRMQILLRAASERDFLDRQAAWFGLMGVEDARMLCPALEGVDLSFEWPEDPGEKAEPLQRALMFDKTVWLPGTLLERGDRLTMAASIEARMPFMDVKLCAFVARLPTQALLRGRAGKQILRSAMKDTLPREILGRPKWGFRVPLHEWLRGRLRKFLGDILLAPSAETSPFVNRRRLRELVDEHDTGRRNREKELWALLALEVFMRTLRQKTPAYHEAA